MASGPPFPFHQAVLVDTRKELLIGLEEILPGTDLLVVKNRFGN
jgi:hypothetical protein